MILDRSRPVALAVILGTSVVFLLFFAHVLGASSSASSHLQGYKASFCRPLTSNAQRTNAAIVVLARNSDLHDLLQSMASFEDRWNGRYNYDYVFLNEEPFSDVFKQLVTAATSSRCQFGLVPMDHWEEPSWIDPDRAADTRKAMAEAGVIYGDSQAYRRMCRYQSGWFFRHPLLDPYEWYWRLEPNVKFFCDIDYDPFRFMQENNKTYGFTVALFEIGSTIPTLWDHSKEFMAKHPQYVARNNALQLISDDNGESYNRCHFWSNFEIGSLKWLRSPAYLAYFDALDRAGGFSYERWGDAPVHTIAASMLLDKSQLHWFKDIGYQRKHSFSWQGQRDRSLADDDIKYCPQNAASSKCRCDPATSFLHWSSECIDHFEKLGVQ